MHKKTPLSIVLGMLLLSGAYNASSESLELIVDVSFIDMHTGPGRGFPKFYSIARGEKLTPIKQRTTWIKVETTKGRRGWIKSHDLEHTRTLDGRPVRLP